MRNNLINLTGDGLVGSMAYKANVRLVQETKPENFIFEVSIFGEDTLNDLLEEFNDKESVREEVFKELDFYGRWDIASIYKLLKEKGFK